MRKFSSYGPIDTELHYYVPRAALIQQAYTQLVGEIPHKGGHYITVWAPRQRGKSWVMREVFQRLRHQPDPPFDVVALSLQDLIMTTEVMPAIKAITDELGYKLGVNLPPIRTPKEFEQVFRQGVLMRPLILILDEFDTLPEAAISGLAAVFRNIYTSRQYQIDLPTAEKDYLLHGLALIGVRAVLGIENQRGSPFNVQRSLHIPNLTEAEVNEMYHWYKRESGQKVEQAVIDRVYYETQGQPGLVSWLGELLTETYNETPEQPITLTQFEEVYSAAVQVLPNNNILNLVSKARQEPYQAVVLELFQTGNKIPFTYDDAYLNFLYLNGVVDWQQESLTERYVKFSCPFVQKRLFNYFARTLFRDTGQLYPAFEDLSDTITEEALNVGSLLRRYEAYLRQNRDWLLKDAPRRADLRVREAVYHFNLYMYLTQFLQPYAGQVWPEFPTGNGKVDLIIHYAGSKYLVEVKSFSTQYGYRKALGQAAAYAAQLGIAEATLALFVDTPVDNANRAKYEVVFEDTETGVTVRPVFVETIAAHIA